MAAKPGLIETEQRIITGIPSVRLLLRLNIVDRSNGIKQRESLQWKEREICGAPSICRTSTLLSLGDIFQNKSYEAPVIVILQVVQTIPRITECMNILCKLSVTRKY